MVRKGSDKFKEARSLLRGHLEKKGLRWTQQREIVLDAFLMADRHISVDELLVSIRSSHPELGHATIYRTMNLFTEAGIAKESRFDEERVRYEPAVDVGHHDHLICTVCGDIEEFEDNRIERLQEEIAQKRGFQVDYHRLELYGKCPKCSN